MQLYLPLLLGGLLFVKNAHCLQNRIPSIGIIGSGIGGASTSHFLTELFGNNNIKIDLYETQTIGGRLATIKIDENEYESGGSIIHSRNRYMGKFVKLLGMEHRSSNGNHKYGIYNGKEFVFEASNWNVITLAKLFYRYGAQPFKLFRYVESILNDFENIYNLQDAGQYFNNVTGLFRAINNKFPQMFEISIRDQLLELGYGEEFIEELVKATLVVNYGQGTNVHSFVGCVSVAGAGDNLWAVKGGNKEVPTHLIYRNKNVNVVPSYVTQIRNILNGSSYQYEIQYRNKGSTDLMGSFYDIVIVAAPLTYDQQNPIVFENFPDDFEFPGDYHTTIATFVKGDINSHYFGFEEPLDEILSCDSNVTIINSIGKQHPVNNGPMKNQSKIWKIFSGESLKSNIINDMFSHVDEVKEVVWKAYPNYSTKRRFDKFKLHDALYHVNAIEWAASAMEMSAIGGRNVAILAYNDFLQKYSSAENDKFRFELKGKQKMPSTEL